MSDGIKGAEALVRTLEAAGVRYLFGLSGTSVIEVLDALVGHPDIHYVTGTHEGPVVAMADGYARASGEVGVVNIHMFPGTANALGGIYNAQRDRVPLVVMCGEQDTRFSGRDGHTETPDMVGLTRQFTKWSWVVPNADRLPEALVRALKTAAAPPRGPVYLAIPKDVLRDPVGAPLPDPGAFHVAQRAHADPAEVERAADLLLAAERPMIVAGSSVVPGGAVRALVELAETLGAAVVSEPYHAYIGFPTTHPLYFHDFLGVRPPSGPYGEAACDVVLAVESRVFMEQFYPTEPAIPPGTTLLHMHTDPWEISKIYPAAVGVVADPRLGVLALLDALRRRITPQRKRTCEARRESVAAARLAWLRAEAERASHDWDATPIKHWRLVKEMKAVLRDDVILVNEATTAKTYVTALFDLPRPEDYFEHSSAFLGWGIGAACGVALARPGRRVALSIGDGCFNFGAQGLWSVARYRLPILMIVFNNRGYVSTKSRLHNLEGLAARERTYLGSDILDPPVDFVHLGLSVGIPGRPVERPDELRPALEWGAAQPGAAIVDVLLDPKETGWYTPPMP